MLLEKNTKLVMIGDSITDCGRRQPIGEGSNGAEGFGYVCFVSALLKSFYNYNNNRVINMGASGDRVRELKERWDRDVLELNPDYLSIMIGINDIWRQFEHPLRVEDHVYIDEYRNTLEELIQKTLPSLKKLILITPFFIESNKDDLMRIETEKYGQVVKELAKKYDAIFVDTQRAFDELLENNYSATFALDRVHPNATGHMAIARAFLDAIGFEWK
ncbi:SGNH/GDSL hydrolase family protein [Clostridium sp. AL.422]|uniref:SGNH/GDSL hydrolase family protein n=1 Tax=Clostridium TaxID=1485 RepID=UPI00293DCB70|nr:MULTISPECIES: SGNH/GDSL hydrolase family protein [unclassified Clostridium]MDV4150710.1 SGNH/GDSL hydrolase family protein [Clostridium sp. AL.422]